MRIDQDLDQLLEAAVDACRVALAEYRAGLLDVDELRSVLVAAGVVHRQHDVWLLDLEAGRWWHYDGVAVGMHAEPVTASTARLRDVIKELTGASAASTDRGTT